MATQIQLQPPTGPGLHLELSAEDEILGIDQNETVYQQDMSSTFSTSDGMGQLPLDMFEAELTAFLQGDVPADVWSNWD